MHANMKGLGLEQSSNSGKEKSMTQEEKDMEYFEKRYQERVSDYHFLSEIIFVYTF